MRGLSNAAALVFAIALLGGCARIGFGLSDRRDGDVADAGRTVDSSRVDAAADSSPQDLVVADGPGKSDIAADLPAADSARPDVGTSDVSAPDVGKPDVAIVPAPCPCKAIFDKHYQSKFALVWPVCTTLESSNHRLVIFPVSQYIDASYIDGNQITTVRVASNSSTSPKVTYRNTCYVRTDSDALVAGPIKVTDAEHAGCVKDIRQREVICRGCRWLENPCNKP